MKKYRDYRTAIARTLTMIQPTDEGLAKGAKAIQEILNLALDPDTIVDSDNARIARLATSNAHNETSGHATQASKRGRFIIIRQNNFCTIQWANNHASKARFKGV
ncbi:hypothetical protein [Lactiplantibacillus plantarum]